MLSKSLFTSNIQTWSTPQEFFDKLNEEFSFTLDPCATIASAKCKKFYTEDDDGLQQNWEGERIFCNPPYHRSLQMKWISKCYEESKKKNTLVVMLLPARTDTKVFHEILLPNSDIRFIKGRLYFGDGKGRAPFPSMLCIFR